MSSPIDTDDWTLAANIFWKPKKQPVEVVCPECNGRGEVGVGFKSLTEAEQCPRCLGRRRITEYPDLAPQPEVPQALIEHMRKAWQEYFKQGGKVG